MNQADALVATKVQVPSAPSRLVRRSRLDDRLDRAVDERHRLVLVSAPAGSGKSTLLAGWVALRPEGVAWLQVESSDADPARFWTYVVAAISRTAPAVGPAVRPSIAASGGDATRVVDALVAELAVTPDPLVVVLDDYHLIDHPSVHEGIERLVELCPDHVSLIVSTRVDPPFRLGRLRVRKMMSEIRADDLRFDAGEAAGLLGSAAPDDPLMAQLCDRTEGWAAGIVLAGLSLSTAHDAAHFIESFRGDDRLVVDYLSDELLSSLSPADRQRLLETSVLERLSGPLIDALTDGRDGSAWLERMARHNQLLIGLDRTGTWFRYHHLLRDLLRLEADRTLSERLGGLHLAAGDWHREHGDIDVAVDHFVRGGDLSSAADLIYEHATELLNGGQFLTVLGQLDRLGDLPRHHVGAAVVRGWTSFVTGQFDTARTWHETAAGLDADHGEKGMIDALGVMLHLANGDVSSALDLADRAIDPAESTQAFALGAARVWAGQFDAARPYLRRADELAAAEPSDFVASVSPVFDAIVEFEAGRPAVAARRAVEGIEYAAAHGGGRAAQLGIGHAIVGRTSSDTEGAVASARRGVELARRAPGNLSLAYTLVWAADVLREAGDPEGVALLEEARALVDRCPDPGLVGAALARVEARHGIDRIPRPQIRLVDELTEREVAVLRLLPSRLSQRDIAAELFVSLNTVKSHCRAIYRKLGVGDRKAAVQAARDAGVL